jgi:membrane protease YdiL (CAAX protease family)
MQPLGFSPKMKTVLKALGTLIFYLALPSFFLWFLMSLMGLKDIAVMPDSLENLFMVAGYVSALVLIAGRFRKQGVLFSQATGFHFRGLGWIKTLQIAFSGVGAGLAISALLNLIPFPERWMEAYDTASLASFTGDGKVIAVFIAAVFLPVSEEIMFRGFLLQVLLKAFSARQSVVAVGLVFGLLHWHPVWIFYAFFLGLLLGWLAIHFENLYASIWFHIGFNVASLPFIFSYESGWQDVLTGNIPVLFLVALAGGSTSVWLLRLSSIKGHGFKG